MALLPLSLPLAVLAVSTSLPVQATTSAVGEAPPTGPGAGAGAGAEAPGASTTPGVPRAVHDHHEASSEAHVPSPECQTCCESNGASCSQAYMGTRPGICCAESHTCCPVGTFCVKQGQRCALQRPLQSQSPSSRQGHSTGAQSSSAPAAAAHPLSQTGVGLSAGAGEAAGGVPRGAHSPAPEGQKTEAGAPGGGQEEEEGGPGQEKGEKAEERGILLPTSLQWLSGSQDGRLQNSSLLHIAIGALLVISLIICGTPFICWKEFTECLFGANGGSRMAPVYAGQQFMSAPPQGVYPGPGQFPGPGPGQYQGAFPGQQFTGPYTGAFPTQY